MFWLPNWIPQENLLCMAGWWLSDVLADNGHDGSYKNIEKSSGDQCHCCAAQRSCCEGLRKLSGPHTSGDISCLADLQSGTSLTYLSKFDPRSRPTLQARMYCKCLWCNLSTLAVWFRIDFTHRKHWSVSLVYQDIQSKRLPVLIRGEFNGGNPWWSWWFLRIWRKIGLTSYFVLFLFSFFTSFTSCLCSLVCSILLGVANGSKIRFGHWYRLEPRQHVWSDKSLSSSSLCRCLNPICCCIIDWAYLSKKNWVSLGETDDLVLLFPCQY